MEITFYLWAVLSQPLLKAQGEIYSFVNVAQRFVLSTACHQSRQHGKVSWPLHLECQKSDYRVWFETKRASVWMHNEFWLVCLGLISSGSWVLKEFSPIVAFINLLLLWDQRIPPGQNVIYLHMLSTVSLIYQSESGDGCAFSYRKDQHQRVAVFLKQNMTILSKIFKCDSKIFQCAFLVLEAAFFPFSLQTETFPWS